MSWLSALDDSLRRGEAAVAVTIMKVEGSAPRGVGTRMLVTENDVVGTIGGGALEYVGVQSARELLDRRPTDPAFVTRRYALGRALSRDRVGKVTLGYDVHPANGFRIEVFGAGHVAQELAQVVRRLPCIATFHDSRGDWLARLGADEWLDGPAGRSAPPRARGRPDIDLGRASDIAAVDDAIGDALGRVRASRHGENVSFEVERCAPRAAYLVMTHSHELDLRIVEAVLARGDAIYCGLVASRSKAGIFRSRLARKGYAPHEIAGLTAPIGAGVQTGNTPMEVAVAAIADVLTARQKARREGTPRAARRTAPAYGSGSVDGNESTGRNESKARIEAEAEHGIVP